MNTVKYKVNYFRNTPTVNVTSLFGYYAYPTEITLMIVLVVVLFVNGLVGNLFVLHRIIS